MRLLPKFLHVVLWSLTTLFLAGCGGTSGVGASNTYQPFFVYVLNQTSSNISEFEGDQNGNMTLIGQVACPAGSTCIVSDILRVFVGGPGAIVSYIIAPNGQLEQAYSVSLPFTAKSLALGYGNRRYADSVYALGGNGSISAFQLGTVGNFFFAYNGTGPSNPGRMVSPTEVHRTPTLFITDAGADAIDVVKDTGAALPKVGTYSIDSNGTTPINAVAYDERNDVVYALDGNRGTLTSFTDDGNGALKKSSALTSGSGDIDLGVDGDGGYVYGLNKQVGTVNVYQAQSYTKAFARIAGGEPPAGADPVAINGASFTDTHMPDQHLAFVATQNGNLRVYGHAGKPNLLFLKEVSGAGTGAVAMTVTANIGNSSYVLPTFATKSFPDGKVNAKYFQPIVLTNATDGGILSVDAGNLPPGLTLVQASEPGNTAGALQGTPTKAGQYTFTLRAKVDLVPVTQSFTMNVDTALSIATTSLPGGTTGLPYSADLLLAGGNGTQGGTWSVSAGSLPPGLSLKAGAKNELLSGSPTVAGTYNFTLKAVEGDLSATQAYIVIIVEGAQPTTLRVFDAASDADDSSDTVQIGGTDFPAVAYGALGTPQTTTLLNSQSYTVTTASSQTWNGSTYIVQNDRNVAVTLGPTAADRKLVTIFNSSSVPGIVNGGFTFVNGIPASGVAMVDAHLLNSAGAEVAHQDTLSYGGFVSFSFTPGTYQLKLTETGNPTHVIATSPLTPISASQSFIDVLVRPSGKAATVLQKEEL
ncbi:MAG TPA: hypothetical protein VG944_00305 [Fimbriimonas sp.]|nr:hypothetical protein [Fimbriimonas sp.]